MEQPYLPPPRSWRAKFAAAFRGWRLGSHGQCSFHVHIPMAIAVAGTAALAGVNVTEWCLLILCIAGVLAAELFNSALENLAKAVSHSRNEHIARALDIASGAVLALGLGAAIVGFCIFVPRFWSL